MGSGVVVTDGMVVLVVSEARLGLRLLVQLWGRCTPSVFSTLEASKTGEKRASLPLWLGDTDTHSPGAGS